MGEVESVRTILFICTGNTCRSPMAQAVAQHWVDGGGLNDGERYLAASGGTAAASGVPSSPEAVRSLVARDITLESRSIPLTEDMIRGASIVFCMTATHMARAKALVAHAPDQEPKIQLLDPERDIEDPMGMGQAAYDQLADRLTELIPRRLRTVFGDEDRAGI